MNTITHGTVLAIIVSSVTGLTLFGNHRYGESQRRPSQELRGFSGLQKQLMQERQEQMIRFISGNDYRPKEVISSVDVVGVLPSNVFKKHPKRSSDQSNLNAASTEVADSDVGESQNSFNYKTLWSDSQFTPERIANHRYTESHNTKGLFERPYGKVRVHTYRGPAKEYWVLPLHHKPEKKTYSQWGYYVKQPVGSTDHKFHSPLDLSFHFD